MRFYSTALLVLAVLAVTLISNVFANDVEDEFKDVHQQYSGKVLRVVVAYVLYHFLYFLINRLTCFRSQTNKYDFIVATAGIYNIAQLNGPRNRLFWERI